MRRSEQHFGHNVPIYRRLFALLVLAAAILTAAPPQPTYLRTGMLPPAWQIALYQYGDRLQKPGKERLVLSGTVSRNGTSTAPFQLVHQLPNLLNYHEPSGVSQSTIVFNGIQFGKSTGALQLSGEGKESTL